MGWIKGLITSRYVKSVVRYLLAAFIAYLNKDMAVPYLDDLIAFLEEHSERLTDIITAILMGLLAGWSVAKNKANQMAEKLSKVKVK
jgi:uncharacterized protein YejL (UPF0352 family)